MKAQELEVLLEKINNLIPFMEDDDTRFALVGHLQRLFPDNPQLVESNLVENLFYTNNQLWGLKDLLERSE